MAGNIDYEVYRLLSKRITPDDRVEYLVRWKGFNSDWDTWEPAENLGRCSMKIRNFERKTKEVTRNYVRKLVKKSKMTKKDPVKQMLMVQPKKKGPGRPKQLFKTSGQEKDLSQDLNFEDIFATVINSPKTVIKQRKKKISRSSGETPLVGNLNNCPKTGEINGETSKPRVYKRTVGNKKIIQSGNKGSVVNLNKHGRKKMPTGIYSFKRKYVKRTSEGQTDNSTMPTNVNKIHVKRKYVKRKKLGMEGVTDSLTPASEKTEPIQHMDKSVGKKSHGKVSVKYGFKKSEKNNLNSSNANKSKLSLSENSKLIKHRRISKSPNNSSKKQFTVSVSHLIGAEKTHSKKLKKDHSHSGRGMGKSYFNKKKHAVGDITLVTDDDSSDDDDDDDDDVLYSLVSDEPTESWATTNENSVRDRVKSDIGLKREKKHHEARHKKMKKPRSKSEGADRLSSQQQGIRLLDSLKTSMAKPVRPVSPTPLFTTVVKHSAATATVLPSSQPLQPQWAVRDESPTTDAASDEQASLPLSPATMSYKVLLENLPRQLHPKKSSKRLVEETEEDVERRISVRATECAFKYKEILIKKCHRYTQIWLNTHTKMKNALSPLVMQEISSALNAAKYDDSNLVMLGGLGNVFCSGLDLHFLTSGDKKVAARQMGDALRDLVRKFTTFPKLIVAVVTGPAIGLGTGILPLCDIVYASDKATFYMPYGQLAQTPEGCASYTIPQCCGVAMASELLMAGRKVTAIEACQLGLVSQVYWPTSMMQEVIPKVQQMALLSGKASETTKLLIRSHQRTKLDLTNESECNLLVERWPTSECQKAMEEFLCHEKNYTL